MTFLQKSYGEYAKVEKPAALTTSYEGLDEEEEPKGGTWNGSCSNVNVVRYSDSDSSEEDFKYKKGNLFDEDINDQVKVSPQTTVTAKVVWALKKFQASYNEDANKIIKEATQDKNAIENLIFLIDLAMVTSDTKPVPEELTTFAKAWNHPNVNFHAKWQEVIKKEFADMNKQEIWHKTIKNLMPPNQRCLKNKWVFKIKCNGVYQVHLIACRYIKYLALIFLKTTLW